MSAFEEVAHAQSLQLTHMPKAWENKSVAQSDTQRLDQQLSQVSATPLSSRSLELRIQLKGMSTTAGAQVFALVAGLVSKSSAGTMPHGHSATEECRMSE